MTKKIMTNSTEKENLALTGELVNQMRKALVRLTELKSNAVETPGKQQEIENLQDFVGQVLISNAGEFIGTWLTVNNEYAPMVRSFAILLDRASAFRAQAQAAKNVQTAKNLVQLTGNPEQGASPSC